MSKTSLARWVREKRKKGTSVAELTQTMLLAGHSETEIHEVFKLANSKKSLKEPAPPMVKPPKKSSSPFLGEKSLFGG